MSSTIYCSFDQQDMADLAIGHIRQMSGVIAIDYSVDSGANSHSDYAGEGVNSVVGWGSPFLAWGNFFGFNVYENTASAAPSRPASVRVVCEDRALKSIRARLVNMHARDIIVS